MDPRDDVRTGGTWVAGSRGSVIRGSMGGSALPDDEAASRRRQEGCWWSVRVSQSVRTSRRPMGGVRAVGGPSTSSIECHTASPSQRATDADADGDDDAASAIGITSSSAAISPRCRRRCMARSKAADAVAITGCRPRPESGQRDVLHKET